MLKRALTNIHRLLGENGTRRWKGRIELAAREMEGTPCKLRLIGEAGDAEQTLDLLAEFRYAEVFHSLGFRVEFIQGANLPDLKATREGHEIYIEVKRFRIVHPGPPPLPEGEFTLEEYGNPDRDIRKTLQNIEDKLRQLPPAHSVIAIWNNDEDLEELEVQDAVEHLSLRPPEDLLFVVYGWPQCVLRNAPPQQLFCFPAKPTLEPWCHQLMADLQKTHIAV